MLSDETKASIGPGVAAALAEDVGAGDLTASLVGADAVVGATIIARESLVLCGGAWVEEELRWAVAAGAIGRSLSLLSPPMPSDSDEI